MYVREAFKRATTARSTFAVARWAQGLPESIRGRRSFGPSAVAKLLSNPVYVARPRSGDNAVLARPVGRWAALVDDETFGRVHNVMASHSRLAHQSTQPYLLTGLLRCPQCGSRMSGCSSPGQLPRYRCRSHMSAANAPVAACNGTALTNVVDDAVLAEIAPLIEAVASDDREMQQALRSA